MKTVLILLTIVTFTACQYQVEVESQNKFEDTRKINDQSVIQNSIPEYVPVHVQYDSRQPPQRFQKAPFQDTNAETTLNYPTELPIAHSSQFTESVPKQRSQNSDERKPKKNVEGDAFIIKYSNINNGHEGYQFGYETSNGISRNEQLTFRDIDEDNKVADIQGGYEFVDPLGRRVVVTYTAGIDGFKPIIKYF